MSDFLSHLAAKNLNLAPVIQPRPLSLFEPVIPRTAPEFGSRFDHETLNISESGESHPPRATSSVQHSPVAASLNPIDPHARSDETTLQRSLLTPPAQITRLSITPQLPERRHEVQREIVNVTNIRQVIEPPIVHSPGSERIVVQKESVVPDRAAPPIGMELAAKPAADEEHVRVTPHPIVTPVIERIIHERERAAPPQAQPRSDQVAPHATSIATQPLAIEPPTIHVTIGRIEVRATPPAAPIKHSPRSSSTVSLEEYLRAREGGKR